ncbi:MAG: hypothetical protein R6V18_05175 [Desulfuromonadaceae bacterium]
MPIALREIFPESLERLSPLRPQNLAQNLRVAEEFPQELEAVMAGEDVPAYLPDLARLELAWYQCGCDSAEIEVPAKELCINPSLNLIEVGWKGLPKVLQGEAAEPQLGSEFVLIWKQTRDELCRIDVASADDLLALKLVAEQLDLHEVAAAQGKAVGVLDRMIDKGVNKGLILQPESLLHRQMEDFPAPETTPEHFLRAEAFTLQ